MKKIMFSDKYGLTEAVLSGRKTQTRRIMTMTLHKKDRKELIPTTPDDMFIASDGTALFQVGRNGYMVPKQNQPIYRVGEEVAVAQPYSDIPCQYRDVWSSKGINLNVQKDGTLKGLVELAGWNNKMYVRADAMPHSIIIRKVSVERLQNISDEDCMAEGIMEGEFMNTWDRYYFDEWGDVQNHITFKRPRDAYRDLINRISGKGTWQDNPWVYVYTFELMR